MPDQLSLPGLDTDERLFKPDVIPDPGGKLQRYTLFLAIFPGEEDSVRLAQAAAELRSLQALQGAPLSAGRLHITLHTLATFHHTIPQSTVDAAIAASASVVCAPLPIVFDHVLSFVKSNAFVLRCDAASDEGIARLRQLLSLALRRVGLHPAPSDTPHMTLLYDTRQVAEHEIAPVCWTAQRFALVLSHVGLGHHQWIAEWALTNRS